MAETVSDFMVQRLYEWGGSSHLPLVGIAVDSNGSEAGSLLITLGKTPEGHCRHRIVAPARVRLKETQTGAVEAVEIASIGDETTLVQFRSAVLPETVDGILE